MKCICKEELTDKTVCKMCRGVGCWGDWQKDHEVCSFCDGSGEATPDNELKVKYCVKCSLIYEQ